MNRSGEPFLSAVAPSRLTIWLQVWSIGTGVTASPEQAEEVHVYIRNYLADNVSKSVSNETRIICKQTMYYDARPWPTVVSRLSDGGSVKPDNSVNLIQQKNIDGFLVGGASLDAKSFIQVAAAVYRCISPPLTLRGRLPMRRSWRDDSRCCDGVTLIVQYTYFPFPWCGPLVSTDLTSSCIYVGPSSQAVRDRENGGGSGNGNQHSGRRRSHCVARRARRVPD